MCKLYSLILVVCLSAVPVMAGDVNTPGKSEPPPCTQNCVTTTTSPTITYGVRQIALELILTLVKR